MKTQHNSGDRIKLVIDRDVLERYYDYYFSEHPRSTKKPIKNPYHESINQWMILPRMSMNNLKQRWKEFIIWFIKQGEYRDIHIDECDMECVTYYKINRRHDVDNTCPKFILDGLTASGFITDDDSQHLKSLTLRCDVDSNRPRTEIYIKILKLK